MVPIWNLFAQIAKAKGMTKRDLSEKSGISYYVIVNGSCTGRNSIHMDDYVDLCRAVGMECDEVMRMYVSRIGGDI